jgi:hypothetical protein
MNSLIISFVMGQSVINRELVERQKLLKEAILPEPKDGVFVGYGKMRARVVPLLPGLATFDSMSAVRVGSSAADIRDMFEEAIRHGVRPHLVNELRGGFTGGPSDVGSLSERLRRGPPPWGAAACVE